MLKKIKLQIQVDSLGRDHDHVEWVARIRQEGQEDVRLHGESDAPCRRKNELAGLVAALTDVARRMDGESVHVTIQSTSEYLINGARDWREAWRRRGWVTADRKPVQYVEAWKRVDALIQSGSWTVRYALVKIALDAELPAPTLPAQATVAPATVDND